MGDKFRFAGYGASEAERVDAGTKGIFKGKERKALTEQIQRAEKEIAERLDKLHPKSKSIFSSGFFRASGAGQVMNNCYPPLTDRRRSALKGL